MATIVPRPNTIHGFIVPAKLSINSDTAKQFKRKPALPGLGWPVGRESVSVVELEQEFFCRHERHVAKRMKILFVVCYNDITTCRLSTLEL